MEDGRLLLTLTKLRKTRETTLRGMYDSDVKDNVSCYEYVRATRRIERTEEHLFVRGVWQGNASAQDWIVAQWKRVNIDVVERKRSQVIHAQSKTNPISRCDYRKV